jgi:hypothetical protein
MQNAGVDAINVRLVREMLLECQRKMFEQGYVSCLTLNPARWSWSGGWYRCSDHVGENFVAVSRAA